MYTKDRNSAGTDEKVTNSANWRIRRWRIRRVILYLQVRKNQNWSEKSQKLKKI